LRLTNIDIRHPQILAPDPVVEFVDAGPRCVLQKHNPTRQRTTLRHVHNAKRYDQQTSIAFPYYAGPEDAIGLKRHTPFDQPSCDSSTQIAAAVIDRAGTLARPLCEHDGTLPQEGAPDSSDMVWDQEIASAMCGS